MIDLCIDARMATMSGIGTCIRQLVPFLNQPPFRVILLVHEKEQPWCKGYEQIHCTASIYSVKEQLSLPLYMPKCDVFWSPHYNIPLLRGKAKKKVVTIHDACHLALSQFLSFPERIYAYFLMQAAWHWSDAVTTVSLFSQTELIRFLGLTRRPVKIITNAVNQEFFQRIQDPAIRVDLQLKYQLPKKFILFVGNLKPHKNLQGLITAFTRVRSDLGSDWGLVVIGKSKGLRNTIGDVGGQGILSVGEVPDGDLPGLYSMANMFVLPSFYEGFGFPALEAMSCGCPTIVSRSASLPEVCGDASVYINPENREEMGGAMLKLAHDTRLQKELIGQGYAWVKRFNWETAAGSYRQLFEEVHKQS